MEKRINYLSLASVISAFAVVMLHTNGCFWNFSTESYWVTANIIETVMYFAVPVFFMITGATLINYRERYSTKVYLKKRLDKTLIPFLFWSIIGVLYNIFKGDLKPDLSFKFVKEIFLGIINSEIISIYWFFVALFGVYLCIPLFSAIEKDVRDKVFLYIIGVSFIFNYFIPFVCQVLKIDYHNVVSVPVGSGYLIYVLLGYLLHRIDFSKAQKVIIYTFGISGLILQGCGTHILSMQAGSIIETYKGYTNIPCLLYSISIFVFIKDVGQGIKNEKIILAIESLSKYTFPVYLLHWYVMSALVYIFKINVYSLTYRIGAPFVIVIICIMITYIARKIPLIRKVLP